MAPRVGCIDEAGVCLAKDNLCQHLADVVLFGNDIGQDRIRECGAGFASRSAARDLRQHVACVGADRHFWGCDHDLRARSREVSEFQDRASEPRRYDDELVPCKHDRGAGRDNPRRHGTLHLLFVRRGERVGVRALLELRTQRCAACEIEDDARPRVVGLERRSDGLKGLGERRCGIHGEVGTTAIPVPTPSSLTGHGEGGKDRERDERDGAEEGDTAHAPSLEPSPDRADPG